MLVILVLPVWLAAIGIALAWGCEPDGPAMITVYIIAALTSFFSLILSDGI